MGFFARRWARTRALVRAALLEQSSPPKVGAAIAVGALLGSSPALGLQTVLAIAFASFFKLNRVLTFVGSNVSFGPLMAVLVWAEVVTGSFFLGRPMPSLHGDMFATAKNALLAWWLGWLAVGPVLGALGYALGFTLAKQFQSRRTSTPATAEEPPAKPTDDDVTRPE